MNIKSSVAAAFAGHPAGPPPQEDDPRVVEALEEYLALLKSDRRPSRTEFLARHRQIADELADCLDGLEFVQSAAGNLPFAGTASSGGDDMLAASSRLGDFRIIREVGRGGMGIVYEAEQVSLGRRVALKVLPFASAIDSRHRQRFQVEAQAAAQLQHAHIVPIHAVGVDRGIHYYAMQFIEGHTLASLIREMRRPGWDFERALSSRELDWANDPTGPYPSTFEPSTDVSPPASHRGRNFPRVVAELGRQAADALEHAHSLGVLHRDIKPANLMVDTTGHLWITDFGLARISDDVGVTRTGDVLGTLRYMSPEQAFGRNVQIDERTDVYSLGVTLYELLTLRPAFDAVDRHALLHQVANLEPISPTRLDRSIPRDLETIVLKSMAKDPLSRYASAESMADDLRRFLEDKPILARRPSLAERTVKLARRHRTALVTALLVLMTGLPVATTLLYLEKGQTEAALKTAETARTHERALLRLAFDMSDEMTMRAMSMVATVSRDGGASSTDFYQKALDFYGRIANQTRDDSDMRFIRAQALKQIGHTRHSLHQAIGSQAAYRESIGVFEELHAERPDDSQIVEQFVRTLELYAEMITMNRGLDLAAPQLRRAVELQRGAFLRDSDNPKFLIGMTRTMLDWAGNYSAAGRKEEADRIHHEIRDVYDNLPRRASMFAPFIQHGAALLGLAMQRLDQDRVDDVLLLHQIGLRLTPENPFLLNSYAWTLVRRPTGSNASLRVGVSSLGVRGGLGAAFSNAPLDALLALSMVNRALAAMPERWEFTHTKGVAFYRLGQWEDAIKTMRESMRERDGGDPHEWLVIAMAEAKLGNHSEAVRWLDRATHWIQRTNSVDKDIRSFRLEAEAVVNAERGKPGAPFEPGSKSAPTPPRAGAARPADLGESAEAEPEPAGARAEGP